MVHGLQLTVHGSWCMVHGSWFMACGINRGKEKIEDL